MLSAVEKTMPGTDVGVELEFVVEQFELQVMMAFNSWFSELVRLTELVPSVVAMVATTLAREGGLAGRVGVPQTPEAPGSPEKRSQQSLLIDEDAASEMLERDEVHEDVPPPLAVQSSHVPLM